MNEPNDFDSTAKLYERAKEPLWRHCSNEHGLSLMESEAFELWLVATATCREEIRRLERLVRLVHENPCQYQIAKNKAKAQIATDEYGQRY